MIIWCIRKLNFQRDSLQVVCFETRWLVDLCHFRIKRPNTLFFTIDVFFRIRWLSLYFAFRRVSEIYAIVSLDGSEFVPYSQKSIYVCTSASCCSSSDSCRTLVLSVSSQSSKCSILSTCSCHCSRGRAQSSVSTVVHEQSVLIDTYHINLRCQCGRSRRHLSCLTLSILLSEQLVPGKNFYWLIVAFDDFILFFKIGYYHVVVSNLLSKDWILMCQRVHFWRISFSKGTRWISATGVTHLGVREIGIWINDEELVRIYRCHVLRAAFPVWVTSSVVDLSWTSRYPVSYDESRCSKTFRSVHFLMFTNLSCACLFHPAACVEVNRRSSRSWLIRPVRFEKDVSLQKLDNFNSLRRVPMQDTCDIRKDKTGYWWNKCVVVIVFPYTLITYSPLRNSSITFIASVTSSRVRTSDIKSTANST